MKNSKLISLAIVILLVLMAVFLNFSRLKNSFVDLRKAISLLGETKTSIMVDSGADVSFADLVELRNKMALVSFEKEDLSLFQKFFPKLLEKRFGLSNISFNIIKQYASLNNKKIFNCNIKFSGDYTQFLKAANNNFPLIFISKLEVNGSVFSVDIYGYVTDLTGEFIYEEGIKSYSVFEQLGVMEKGDKKIFENSLVFVGENNVYFLKPTVEAKSYFVCENIVKYLQTKTYKNSTFLVLPVKDDFSVQE
jgi:hypothetical protein